MDVAPPPRRPSASGLVPTALSFGLLACALAGCGAPEPTAAEQRRVAEAFVERVVLPGLDQLQAGGLALEQALSRLAAQPDAARLLAARQAWRSARRSWERAESRSFGPAASEGFDARIDAWPVNRRDLEGVLAAPGLDSAGLQRLTASARGFHGIEAVLFGADPLGPQRLTYLRLAGADLAGQVEGLRSAWRGTDGHGGYANRFLRGQQPEEAIAEILEGMEGTLAEVAAEKLGDPLRRRDPAGLESLDADGTGADLLANLDGIREGLERSGLGSLLDRSSPAATRRLRADLARSLQLAAALPPRLDQRLGEPGGRAAMEQLRKAVQATASDLAEAAGEMGG